MARIPELLRTAALMGHFLCQSRATQCSPQPQEARVPVISPVQQRRSVNCLTILAAGTRSRLMFKSRGCGSPAPILFPHRAHSGRPSMGGGSDVGPEEGQTPSSAGNKVQIMGWKHGPGPKEKGCRVDPESHNTGEAELREGMRARQGRGEQDTAWGDQRARSKREERQEGTVRQRVHGHRERTREDRGASF